MLRSASLDETSAVTPDSPADHWGPDGNASGPECIRTVALTPSAAGTFPDECRHAAQSLNGTMEARAFNLEGLPNAALAQVRFARTCGLHSSLGDLQRIFDLPTSRAFRSVGGLRLRVDYNELQEGCWERMADALSRALERWEDIQEVELKAADPCASWDDEALEFKKEVPLLVLRGAAALRRLALDSYVTICDLDPLEALTQVTSLQLQQAHLGDEPPPLVLCSSGTEPKAPLAVLTHLQRLTLPGDNSLTGWFSGQDYTCPLAFPPHLTYLSLGQVQCQPGAAWRHIGALKDLQELHLVAGSEVAQDHPSWGLQQLSSSLRGLTRLVLRQPDDGFILQESAEASLPQLMQLLYGTPQGPAPQPAAAAAAEQEAPAAAPAAAGQEAPAAAAAAAEQEAPATARAVVQVIERPAAIKGIPAGYAAMHLMVPPPGLAAFSSLKVLQLPYEGGDSWGMVCSTPYHWRTLAACTALRQLEGLHASQLPPEGVKFPGVTRLEAAVAAGDVFPLLAAFPALREVKLDVVLNSGAAEQAAGAAAELLPTFPSIQRLALDFHRFYTQEQSTQLPAGDPTAAAELVAVFCGTLWRCMPCVEALEVVWPSDVRLLLQPLSLAPLERLTSLVLAAKPCEDEDDRGLEQEEVRGLLALLLRPVTLQQVELQLDLTTWAAPVDKQDEQPEDTAADAGNKKQLPGAKMKWQLPDPALGRAILLWLASLLQVALPDLERLQLVQQVLWFPLDAPLQEALHKMQSRLLSMLS